MSRLIDRDGWVALNWQIGAESPRDRGINILRQGHLAGRSGGQVFADAQLGMQSVAARGVRRVWRADGTRGAGPRDACDAAREADSRHSTPGL